MSSLWSGSSRSTAPATRSATKTTRPRPSKCFVRVVPAIACDRHSGPITLSADPVDPRRLDLPGFESVDGRQRSGITAVYDGVYDGASSEVDAATDLRIFIEGHVS